MSLLALQAQMMAGGAVGPSPWVTEVTADSPVAWWRLGDSSGTTAANIGSGGVSGTYNGGFTLNTPGLVTADTNAAVTLNGTSGYVLAGNSGTHNFSRNFTVEAIVKPSALGSDRAIVSKGNGGYYLRINGTSGKLEFIKSQVALIGTGATSLSTGTKYHVALTVDPSGNWAIYLNGVLDASGTTAQTFSGAAGVLIGVDYFSIPNVNFYAGVMDEVALYSTALSAARIAAHAAAA